MASKKSSKKKVCIGDFVSGETWAERELSVGLVCKLEDSATGYALDLLNEHYLLKGPRYYKRGYNWETFSLSAARMKRITKDTALRRIDAHCSFLDEKVKLGGLPGSLAVIRRRNLGILMDRFKSSKNYVSASLAEFPLPNTGSYVVVPAFQKKDDNEMEFLVVEPRRPVKILEELMYVLFPGGTENIHANRYLTYHAYELPEEGLHLVQHPLRLKVDIGYEVTF